MQNMEYAGFWIRVCASLIDTMLMLIIIAPALSLIYGMDYWLSETYFFGLWDVLFNYVFPAIAVILFWIYKQATPGKMAFRLQIVDADTGQPVPTPRLIGRYLGYYVSMIPLLLGLIWVGIDKKKQGWHDKLARTVVIRHTGQQPVHFDGPGQ